MAKTKEYKAGKVANAVPVKVTVADAKFQPGDRVRLTHGVTVWGRGRVDTGTALSVKRQGDYEYAVVAMDPYGGLVMPRTGTLTKLEKEKA